MKLDTLKQVDRRQVLCRLTDPGSVWIGYYDRMPRELRARLRDAPFNLCPACLSEAAEEHRRRGLGFRQSFEKAIAEFEQLERVLELETFTGQMRENLRHLRSATTRKPK